MKYKICLIIKRTTKQSSFFECNQKYFVLKKHIFKLNKRGGLYE